MVQSNPKAILIGIGSLVAGYLAIGYVPAIASLAGLRDPWIPALFAILGAFCSYLAWRHQATGPIGSTCMLLDTALYTSSLTLAAVRSEYPFSLGFSIALALFLLAFPSRVYSLTWLIALATTGPSVVITALWGHDATVALVVWAACSLAITASYRTGQQRALVQQNLRLRNALGTADQVAEHTMETALAASLLDIGHFLHELRNLRAVEQTNLQFVREEGKLEGDVLEALDDAIAAQDKENALISEAIERLRRKATPAKESFSLHDVLSNFVHEQPEGLALTLDFQAPPFQMQGDPRHVLAVLSNLIRNSQRAGATQARIALEATANAKAVALVVEDNGPGLRESQIPELFKPFTSYGEGLGLGLYLTSRYVQLLGGQIEGENRPSGGAVFRILLPGKPV